MTTHHTVLHETGAAARMLINEFNNPSMGRGDPITFITWLVATRQLDQHAKPEEVFAMGPDEAITGNWTAKDRNYTVILYQDPDGIEQPFVTLIENRSLRSVQTV